MAHAQRTDLTGKRTYGSGITDEAVRTATPNTAPSRNVPTGGPPPPGSLTSLTAPTQRPNEPVTAGLPLGAGAGPEVLTARTVANDALYDLRALAAKFPEYTGLLRAIALAEQDL